MNDELTRSDLLCFNPEARMQALQRDAAQGMPFQLAELWLRLRSGEWRLRDAFSERGHWYAVVEATAPGTECERRSRSGLAMLEQVLLGQTSKVVAIERNLSPSAVASAMRTVLDSIGLDCRLRGVPQILMLSARLSRSPSGQVPQVPSARIAGLAAATRATWVVSTRCPRFDMLDALSRAERAVMLQVLDGCDYKQIASARKTSLRTVANQVTMAFRKLGVSGRAELVDRLLQCSLGTPGGRPAPPRVRAAPSLAPALSFS
jgi:DNA-binding CsgD family transcriptional regulator